jgi:hypothetical protein
MPRLPLTASFDRGRVGLPLLEDLLSYDAGLHQLLPATASYTREHVELFVSNGPGPRTPATVTRRCQAIMDQADRLDALAQEAAEGRAAYSQFEAILGELQRLGFFPETSLVSAVARSMVGDPSSIRVTVHPRKDQQANAQRIPQEVLVVRTFAEIRTEFDNEEFRPDHDFVPDPEVTSQWPFIRTVSIRFG